MLPDPPMAFVIAELPSDPESDDELQPLPQRAIMIAIVPVGSVNGDFETWSPSLPDTV